ncbi:TetR/AcrR family transcriptional regulator [Streptomyces sp. NBC_01411]|uniref:TetR family transcriptional regulator n=1 Tax=Streptomyces sp. NBC_01411 TaxID=2903857 RepID=UPI003255CFEA
MPGPHQDRARTTRERLVHGAALVFADLGYTASLSDITEAIGISKGGFYHHFRTKDAIAAAVIDGGVVTDEPMSGSALAPPTGGHPWAQLMVDLASRLAALTPEVPAIRAAHRLATEPSTPFFGQIWRHYLPAITHVLQQAHEMGELLPWIDSDEMARTWIAAYTGYDLMRRSDPENLPQDIVGLNRSMVVQGVRLEVQRELDLTIQRGRNLAAAHPLYARAKALAAAYS